MATNGLSERSASQSGSVHCRNTRKTVCQKVIQAKYIQKIEQNEPRQSLSRAPRIGQISNLLAHLLEIKTIEQFIGRLRPNY